MMDDDSSWAGLGLGPILDGSTKNSSTWLRWLMIVGDEEESQQLMLVREAEGEAVNISRVPWNSEKSGSKQVEV